MLSAISFLFIVEQYYSYEKVNTLRVQVTLISKIQKESKKIDVIQFNNHIATINNEINNLRIQSQYNYISIYLLENSSFYHLRG